MGTEKGTLSRKTIVAYACGVIGVSHTYGMINVYLIMFYVPPKNLGLPDFISQATILGFLNVMAIAVFVGRFFDAIIDPWIANRSDRSRNPKGRRFPFMKLGMLCPIFLVLLFSPPVDEVSAWNVVWLILVQLAFYVCFSLYTIPYNSLIVDLSKNKADRAKLSMATGIGGSISGLLTFQVPLAWGIWEKSGHAAEVAMQRGFILFAVLAAILMLIPFLVIKDRPSKEKTVESDVTPSGTIAALKMLAADPYMRPILAMFLVHTIAAAMTNAAGPYYLNVLLQINIKHLAGMGAVALATTLLTAPFVTRALPRVGCKKMFMLALIQNAVLYVLFGFLGKGPIPPVLQGYLSFAALGVAGAFARIAFPAMIGDAATHSFRAGREMSALYYASSGVVDRIAFSIGSMVFPAMLVLGKDPGDDWGIRVPTFIAGLLMAIAAVMLSRGYDERKLHEEMTAKAA